jgi:hypothetical protein
MEYWTSLAVTVIAAERVFAAVLFTLLLLAGLWACVMIVSGRASRWEEEQ